MRKNVLKLYVLFSVLLSGCSGIWVSDTGPSTELCAPVTLNDKLLGFDCINHKGESYFKDPHQAQGSLLVPIRDYHSLLDYCTVKGSR